VRASGVRRQVRAEVELRGQERDAEEERQRAETQCFAGHVYGKTKVRQDWLRGQATMFASLDVFLFIQTNLFSSV
jgi:hypothetical protein